MQQDRFKDAPWFEESRKVECIIGGAGGIGSWVAFFLSRIGYKLKIYDFDTVEEHNLGGQLFMHDSVGKPKVDALVESISKFNFYSNYTHTYESSIENYEPYYNISEPRIFVSCFDNMEARKIMFNKYIEHCNNVQQSSYAKIEPIFIDGRLLMEQLDIFFVNSEERRQKYAAEQLFDDAEVEELPCSMKQTSHSAAMIASHMVGMITNFTTNVSFREKILENPYHWGFVIPTQHTDYDR